MHSFFLSTPSLSVPLALSHALQDHTNFNFHKLELIKSIESIILNLLGLRYALYSLINRKHTESLLFLSE